jgi:hypothetical protein
LEADADDDLTAGGTGQELAKRNQVGVVRVGQPTAPFDELVAKIADMRDRSAETRRAETEEDPEELA